METLFDSSTSPEFAPVPGRPRRRALVVDDQEIQGEVLSLQLNQLGFQCETRTRGDGVVELARRLQPHLILLDVELPDADGLEICASLNDHPETLDIPVVILSGSERANIVKAARAAGCRFFVNKPYDPGILTLIVDALSDPF
jgi:CheY-like chemotaxis protein